MGAAMLTACASRALTLRCSSCSSTNASADRSPTAASTTNPTSKANQTANWKPPITKLTRPSRTSLTCYKPHDVTERLLKYLSLQIKIQESKVRVAGFDAGQVTEIGVP